MEQEIIKLINKTQELISITSDFKTENQEKLNKKM